MTDYSTSLSASHAVQSLTGYRTSIREWVDQLHKEAHIVHTGLGLGDNILFNPSRPKTFFVVGWNDAKKDYDASEEEHDNKSVSYLIQRVTLKKSPDFVSPTKKLKEIIPKHR